MEQVSLEDRKAGKYLFRVLPLLKPAWQRVSGSIENYLRVIWLFGGDASLCQPGDIISPSDQPLAELPAESKKVTSAKSLFAILIVVVVTTVLVKFQLTEKGQAWLEHHFQTTLGDSYLAALGHYAFELLKDALYATLSVVFLVIGARRMLDRPIKGITFMAIMRHPKNRFRQIFWCSLIVVLITQVAVMLVLLGVVLYSMPPELGMETWGLVTVIIGGILSVYLTETLRYSMLVMLDKQLTPWEAVKTSYQVTKHYWIRLVILDIIKMFILLTGLSVFVIGLAWAFPWVFNIEGNVYLAMFGGEG